MAGTTALPQPAATPGIDAAQFAPELQIA
jgi:hypothetical protein